MTSIEPLLIQVKVITAIAAITLAGLGVRAALRRSDRASCLMAAGLSCIGLAAMTATVGGLLLSFDLVLWLAESLLVLAGVGFLLASTWDW